MIFFNSVWTTRMYDPCYKNVWQLLLRLFLKYWASCLISPPCIKPFSRDLPGPCGFLQKNVLSHWIRFLSTQASDLFLVWRCYYLQCSLRNRIDEKYRRNQEYNHNLQKLLISGCVVYLYKQTWQEVLPFSINLYLPKDYSSHRNLTCSGSLHFTGSLSLHPPPKKF